MYERGQFILKEKENIEISNLLELEWSFNVGLEKSIHFGINVEFLNDLSH